MEYRQQQSLGIFACKILIVYNTVRSCFKGPQLQEGVESHADILTPVSQMPEGRMSGFPRRRAGLFSLSSLFLLCLPLLLPLLTSLLYFLSNLL